MAIFGLYGKSKGQKKKEEYLRLFSDRIKKGDKTVPTFANWVKRKTKGSIGTRKQLKRLSPGDYKALQRFKRKR